MSPDANIGYPRPSILDYLEWLMLYGMFTEKGLRKRAEMIGKCPYQDILLAVADARATKGLSGVNAMKIVHEAQRQAGVR